VLFAYDKDTRTIGGVTKVYDKDAGAWQPLDGASSDPKMAALGTLVVNQYFDVSIKSQTAALTKAP